MKEFFEIEPGMKFKPIELPNMGIPQKYFLFDQDASDDEKRYESFTNKLRSKFEFDQKDFMEKFEKRKKKELRQKKLDSLW